MAEEKPDSDRQTAGPQGDVKAAPVDGPEPQRGSDYDALLLRYGESMLRIGHLEARVDDMSRQLEESASQGASPFPESQSLRTLAELVDSFQKLIPESPTSEDEKPHEDVPEDRSREDELQQMRVQTSSLAYQLATAEKQLEEVQNQQPRRRRRKTDHRPWWKKIARRLVQRGARSK